MQKNAQKTRLEEALSLVDFELRDALKAFPEFELNKHTLREVRRLPPPSPLTFPSYREVTLECPDRKDGVRMVIVDPGSPKEQRPALLYFHGGGFVFGSPEIILPTMQKLAVDVGCVIFLPAYSLAPEAAFPSALEDNYLALSWVHENASALGIDPNRIAIGGDSAGGGHAALIAVTARDKEEFPIAFQFLLYPMLDDRTGSVFPITKNTGDFVWTSENNKFCWNAYLNGLAGGENIPEDSVPARIKNLNNLPPTFIATGTLDLFVTENKKFAQRLKNHGVKVELKLFNGAYHGFNVMVPEAEISKRFHDHCVKGLINGLQINRPLN